MTTYKEFSITGQLCWAKVHSPVNKYQSQEQQYELLVEVNDRQVAAIHKLEDSTNRKVRKVEGLSGTFMKFSRPVLSKTYKVMPPPKVLGADGLGTEDLLGNGTIAKVTFTRIPTNKGNEVVRFNKIEVIDLVVFEKKEALPVPELGADNPPLSNDTEF